jgi:eukaryotic-like serine/threonine-protein kinase
VGISSFEASQLIAGRFELDRVLGRGGMSEVWLAQDHELDRPVAVKILSPAAAPVRFDREARSGAALSHPNVVGVFDCGEVEGRPYLVLEYLPGGTLEDVLSAAGGAPLEDEVTTRIAWDVAAGLAHAHEHGIVHRDLKPSNILFDAEATAKIADFGIARGASDTTLTPPGALPGTLQYMAPEQATGESAGPESDVYAFGVILFEMLTGRPAFEGDRPIAAVLERSVQPAPRVESHRADAPPALAALAASTLANDRTLRPTDGSALLRALEGESAVSPATASTQGLSARPMSRRRRRLAVPVALCAAAVAGVAAALLLTRNTAEAPAVPDPAAPAKTTPARTTAGAGAGVATVPTAGAGAGTPTEGTTAPTAPETETGATTAPETTTPTTTETTPTTTAPSAPPTTTAP